MRVLGPDEVVEALQDQHRIVIKFRFDEHDIADRIARVADEHASKVLDLNRQMSMRVVEMLGNSDDARIRENQKPIHERLSEIGEGSSEVQRIVISRALLKSVDDSLASAR